MTRSYGKPGDGVEAIQLELACRGYMVEPTGRPRTTGRNRSTPPARHVTRATLRKVLESVLEGVRKYSRPACGERARVSICDGSQA